MKGFILSGVFDQSSLSELKKLHYLQTFPNLQKGVKFFLIFNTIFKNYFSLEHSLCLSLFMFGCVRAQLLRLGSCVVFSCSMGCLNCNMWDLVPQPRIRPGPPALGSRSLSHWTTGEVPKGGNFLIGMFLTGAY